jgi:DNA (cytosine-5)-methyltransferase 1
VFERRRDWLSKIKVLSLASGIGAPEKALTNLKINYDLVGFSEIDKFAVKSYCAIHNVDKTNNLGDATKIDETKLDDFDLLVSGFPCQSFSVAGKRLGFEDTRGTLFFEVARIAKYKKPKYILLENVKGLVNHDKGRTLEIILKTLCDIGYVVDFNVLNSKYFGVPQNRERVFIIAKRNDLINCEPWIIKGTNIVVKAKKRLSEINGINTFNFNWPPQKEVTTRLRDILEDNVDERYYLSEEKTAKLVAQLEIKEPNEVRAVALQNGNMQGRRVKDNDEPSFTVSATDRHGVALSEPQMIGHVEIKGHDAIKRVYSTEGISPTLTTMGGGYREPKIAEPQILQIGRGYNNGGKHRIAPPLTSHSYEQNNFLAVLQSEQQIEQFTQGNGISYCIDANYSKGTSPGDFGKARRTHVVEEVQPKITVAPKYRIRKLTPKECWRLMGFSDDDFEKAARLNSDTQLYKQAGNSIVVNVLEYIFKELLKEYI